MQGLYVITDPELIPSAKLVSSVGQAIAGGACLVQYRNKTASAAQKLWEAQDLMTLCTNLSVPLIINDDIELAKKVGAAGVHLGQNDISIEKARELLGDEAIIGLSCHDNFAFALEAEKAGANYVAFGSFFASSTKPQAIRAKSDLLLEAKEKLKIPIVAIGGITPKNAKKLIMAGADMLAVINGVFGTAAIENSAKLIQQQFNE